MYDRYPGMEQDMVDMSYSIHFWQEWEKNPGDADGIKERVERDAIAKMYQLLHTADLKNSYDDVLIILLNNARRDRWYEHIGDGIAEIGSVAGLLGLALDREEQKRPSGGMKYEYQQTLRVLATLEQIALAAEAKAGRAGKEAKRRIEETAIKMITTPEISSKIRESGAVLDHLINSTDASEVEKLSLAQEVLDDIVDQDVTFLNFRENNRERMGKARKTVLSMQPGMVYILGDREIIVIESRGQGYTRAIESKLKGLVTELDVRDGVSLLNRINELIVTKHKQHRYIITEGKLKRHGNGTKMPTQEEFTELCNRYILPQVYTIKRYFGYTTDPLFIRVFEITGGLVPQDVNTFIYEAFKLRGDDQLLERASRAITNSYEIPVSIAALFPEKSMKPVLHLDNELRLGIFVEIS